MNIDGWAMCPCDGTHSVSAHARVMAEQPIYAAAAESGDWHDGMEILFRVLGFLGWLFAVRGEPRCHRRSKLGPHCKPYVTIEHGVRTINYCGID